MEFSLALLLGFSFILLISWIFREIKCIHQTFLCSLPGPKGLPILGNLLPLLQSYSAPFRQYSDWAKEYGSFYKVKVGTQLAVVVCDTDKFAQVFGKTGSKLNYRVRGNVLSFAMGNKGIATSDGKVWADHRRFTTRAFRDLSIGRSSTENLIFTEVVHFIERMKMKCEESKTGWYEGVESDLNLSVFSVLWTFVCGHSDGPKSQTLVNDENIRKILLGTRAQLRAAEQSGGWNFFFLLQVLWIIAANPLKLLPSYIRRVMFAKKELTREKSLQKQGVFDTNDNLVQMYLHEIKNRAEHTELNDLNLEVFMSDFIVAGVESLTSSIRWTLLYLATNPECLEKLRQEFDTFLQHSTLSELASYSSRTELPYLEAVIAESLRICPVVHTIVHVTHEDFVVADHFIPKDTWVMGNVWAVHHDPKVFPNPEAFQPERFLQTREGGCPSSSSFRKELADKCFSFSTGPRRCLGEQLSRMELHAFIALIVHQFDMQINPKKLHKFTLHPYVSLSLIPKDDYLIFKPR